MNEQDFLQYKKLLDANPELQQQLQQEENQPVQAPQQQPQPVEIKPVQQQEPQFNQGLLGGGEDNGQQQAQEIVNKGSQLAGQMAQGAEQANQQLAQQGDSFLQQRQASTNQAHQQMLQQQQQAGAILGKIAAQFIPGLNFAAMLA